MNSPKAPLITDRPFLGVTTFSQELVVVTKWRREGANKLSHTKHPISAENFAEVATQLGWTPPVEGSK